MSSCSLILLPFVADNTLTFVVRGLTGGGRWSALAQAHGAGHLSMMLQFDL